MPIMEIRPLLRTFILPAIASESSLGISRSAVISNASTWLKPPVPYNRHEFKEGYRTDSSGFVSMAWASPINYNTNMLIGVTKAIKKEELKSGDILLKAGSHVTIFDRWVDPFKTRYWGFEQVGGRINTTKHWKIPYPYWRNGKGYQPRRYIDIRD